MEKYGCIIWYPRRKTPVRFPGIERVWLGAPGTKECLIAEVLTPSSVMVWLHRLGLLEEICMRSLKSLAFEMFFWSLCFFKNLFLSRKGEGWKREADFKPEWKAAMMGVWFVHTIFLSESFESFFIHFCHLRTMWKVQCCWPLWEQGDSEFSSHESSHRQDVAPSTWDPDSLGQHWPSHHGTLVHQRLWRSCGELVVQGPVVYEKLLLRARYDF